MCIGIYYGITRYIPRIPCFICAHRTSIFGLYTETAGRASGSRCIYTVFYSVYSACAARKGVPLSGTGRRVARRSSAPKTGISSVWVFPKRQLGAGAGAGRAPRPLGARPFSRRLGGFFRCRATGRRRRRPTPGVVRARRPASAAIDPPPNRPADRRRRTAADTESSRSPGDPVSGCSAVGPRSSRPPKIRVERAISTR